ncbi:hypothetical protein P7K49_026129 [Saguinus oedipus]|uniref:Uncharacterized protein n=1 Tax=Saguinus oedipus TaxID=9490 RepID=A0ABQ9UJZ2_SAGOE|nr:hypothetical protein P7K49_026129 [Saguinus oedipus]
MQTGTRTGRRRGVRVEGVEGGLTAARAERGSSGGGQHGVRVEGVEGVEGGDSRAGFEWRGADSSTGFEWRGQSGVRVEGVEGVERGVTAERAWGSTSRASQHRTSSGNSRLAKCIISR